MAESSIRQTFPRQTFWLYIWYEKYKIYAEEMTIDPLWLLPGLITHSITKTHAVYHL